MIGVRRNMIGVRRNMIKRKTRKCAVFELGVRKNMIIGVRRNMIGVRRNMIGVRRNMIAKSGTIKLL